MVSHRYRSASNPCPLTLGQFECLSLLAAGNEVDEIARIRKSTASSVRSLISAACKSLSVQGRVEAVKRLRESGWLKRPAPPAAERPISAAQQLYLREVDKLLAKRHNDGPAFFTGGGSAAQAAFLTAMFYESDKEPPQ